MLLRFGVANVLSLRDEQMLTFVVPEINDGTGRPTGIREGEKAVSMVPVTGIFGANASGKTNVLAALGMMRDAVLGSTKPGERLNRLHAAFALSPEHRDAPSRYEVDIIVDEVRCTYGFELDDERVLGEWLHAYPRGRRQVRFDRHGDDIRFAGKQGHREKTGLASRTPPDALYLTAAAERNDHHALPVLWWFRDKLAIVGPGDDDSVRLAGTRTWMASDPAAKAQLAGFLRAADLGVVDIEVGSAEEIRLVHETGDGHRKALDLEDESSGTLAIVALLGPLLAAINRGGVLLADELDSGLHPNLAAEIVRVFDSVDANPNNAQLLFTTHKSMLLRSTPGGRVLGRESVWFTEKASDGATTLYPLVSLRPRKEESLERGYLLGRYGAAPRVAPGEMARVLEDALDSR